MRRKRLVVSLFALVLILLLSGCGTSAGAHQISSHPVSTAVSQRVHATTPGPLPANTTPAPSRLIIPAIHLNTSIEMVDILPDGNLGTPLQGPWDNVGWYAKGPHPGYKGSSVIDGHLDRPGGYPAVFWNLRLLHSGDNVQVIDTQGKLTLFRVTQVAYYRPQDAPVQEIFGNNQGNFLNLITCAGDWIPSQHQTTFRLVVYTTEVS